MLTFANVSSLKAFANKMRLAFLIVLSCLQLWRAKNEKFGGRRTLDVWYGSRARLELVVRANDLEMRLASTSRNAFEPASEQINGLLNYAIFFSRCPNSVILSACRY